MGLGSKVVVGWWGSYLARVVLGMVPRDGVVGEEPISWWPHMVGRGAGFDDKGYMGLGMRVDMMAGDRAFGAVSLHN